MRHTYILIELVPVEAETTTAHFELVSLLPARTPQAWKIGKRHGQNSSIGELHP